MGFIRNRLFDGYAWTCYKISVQPGDSGSLYPQSATEGVMAGFGLSSCEAAHGKWR